MINKFAVFLLFTIMSLSIIIPKVFIKYELRPAASIKNNSH